MCGKSRKHWFNTEVIVDSSISHAWTPHALFLSDRNNPLWECWYNLSNLTNQMVYQELVYRNGSFEEMITGSSGPALPSFLPFYFRVRAFSIQRARLSRSLEQANKVCAWSPWESAYYFICLKTAVHDILLKQFINYAEMNTTKPGWIQIWPKHRIYLP